MSRPRVGEVAVVGQRVPDDFAVMLRSLHSTRRGTALLRMLLKAAADDGWTLAALAEALGMTPEGVRQHVLRAPAEPASQLLRAAVPDPPRHEAPPPKPPKPPAPNDVFLTAEVVEELRRMYAIARTVKGSTPVDNPARRVTEQLTARLAALVDQGVTRYRLAKVLGITYSGVTFRLGRHGFRTLPPSINTKRDQAYRNITTKDAAAVRTQCRRGHPYPEHERRWPGGQRYCDICERARRARRYERAPPARSPRPQA